ncbi:MAG: PspC domain-containing protein [Ruminococcus sp.]
MNINTINEQNIIERDVHCPYCDSDKALLISEISEQRSILQMPDYGKKYWLCVIFTFGLYMLVHGFPMIEKKRVYGYTTYGFCPHCGKTYNAGVPASKVNKTKSPKLYRSLEQKKIFGICGGIAEFTGLSIKLVRIVMVLYCFGFMPAIIYFILGLFDIIPVNPKQINSNS